MGPFLAIRTILESGEERLENWPSFTALLPLPDGRPWQGSWPAYFFYLPAVRFRNPQLIHTLGSRLTFFPAELNPGLF